MAGDDWKAERMKVAENMFEQQAKYRALMVLTRRESVVAVEAALDEMILSSAAFECAEDSEEWRIEMVLAEEVEEHEIDAAIELLKKSGVTIDKHSIETFEIRDWVSEIQSQFPPLEIGRFYIHGSHIEAARRPAISLEINAGRAFGTGEHATTACCLEALEWLKRFHSFKHVLDLGCGTGILALAAKQLWRTATIVGSDMDAVSIDVARENSVDNAAPSLRYYVACGFDHPALARSSYDLIIANILARPLIGLAPAMTKHVCANGYIVLSGLLTRQEKDVLLPYRNMGFSLVKAFRRSGWSALILQKKRFA